MVNIQYDYLHELGGSIKWEENIMLKFLKVIALLFVIITAGIGFL